MAMGIFMMGFPPMAMGIFMGGGAPPHGPGQPKPKATRNENVGTSPTPWAMGKNHGGTLPHAPLGRK